MCLIVWETPIDNFCCWNIRSNCRNWSSRKIYTKNCCWSAHSSRSVCGYRLICDWLGCNRICDIVVCAIGCCWATRLWLIRDWISNIIIRGIINCPSINWTICFWICDCIVVSIIIDYPSGYWSSVFWIWRTPRAALGQTCSWARCWWRASGSW